MKKIVSKLPIKHNVYVSKINQRSENYLTIMNYISLNNNSKKVNFENALINGLAPDKGLYFTNIF